MQQQHATTTTTTTDHADMTNTARCDQSTATCVRVRLVGWMVGTHTHTPPPPHTTQSPHTKKRTHNKQGPLLVWQCWQDLTGLMNGTHTHTHTHTLTHKHTHTHTHTHTHSHTQTLTHTLTQDIYIAQQFTRGYATQNIAQTGRYSYTLRRRQDAVLECRSSPFLFIFRTVLNASSNRGKHSLNMYGI